MSSIARLTFCGGAGSVTGANFLLEIDGKKILIDCGLVQGLEIADELNWADFLYDPKDIDILFITHAHIDHIGKIPKLIHEGFKGKIYSTRPTRELTKP
ncbi:MAG: MBL fold metallo-hydrolase, partial [Patescibacteria group bacterium]